MFKENMYDGNVYCEMADKHELSIRVMLNATKTKGILVIAPEEYISVGGHKQFI